MDKPLAFLRPTTLCPTERGSSPPLPSADLAVDKAVSNVLIATGMVFGRLWAADEEGDAGHG